jgi:type II secretion system protein C
MLKWLLAGVLVWTMGWVGMVYRRPGPGLGPSIAMAVPESALPEAEAAKGVPIRIPEVNYAAVLAHDPFGGSQGLAPQTLEAEISGEALGVTLVGTVSGSAPLARVVLRDVKTKATTVYRIGDHVGEAILESVAKDSAVFLAGHRRLVLKRPAAGSVGTTPALVSGDRVAEDRKSAAPAAAQPQAATPRPAADAMGEFLDRVTATPARGENGAEGLRISGLDQIPAARQLGLEEGDVICAVNGQSLADPRKAFQVFRKVKSQDSIQVDLVRKGQSKTLSLNLR